MSIGEVNMSQFYLQHISCNSPKRVWDDEKNRAGGMTRSPASFLIGRYCPVQGQQSIVTQLQVVPHKLDRTVVWPTRLIHTQQEGICPPRPPYTRRVIAKSPAVFQEIVSQGGRFADECHGACFLIGSGACTGRLMSTVTPLSV